MTIDLEAIAEEYFFKSPESLVKRVVNYVKREDTGQGVVEADITVNIVQEGESTNNFTAFLDYCVEEGIFKREYRREMKDATWDEINIEERSDRIIFKYFNGTKYTTFR